MESCRPEGEGRGGAGNKETRPGGQRHLHSEGQRGRQTLTNILVGTISIYFRKPRKLTNLTWRENAWGGRETNETLERQESWSGVSRAETAPGDMWRLVSLVGVCRILVWIVLRCRLDDNQNVISIWIKFNFNNLVCILCSMQTWCNKNFIFFWPWKKINFNKVLQSRGEERWINCLSGSGL